jgi:transcriptional regulator with XRE-family HTH domain
MRTDTIALKKIMLEQGFNTIGELSKASGINRNTLGYVLCGKWQPSAETMRLLVDTLRIDPSAAGEIFFRSNLREMQVDSGD